MPGFGESQAVSETARKGTWSALIPGALENHHREEIISRRRIDQGPVGSGPREHAAF